MRTQYTNLPSLLKKKGLFCLWQYETRDGKKTKVPYCIRGYRADPGDKNTFSKFEQVVSLEKLTSELEIIVELIRKCIEENSTLAQDQNEYTARYNGYVERYESTQARIQEPQKQKAERKEKYDAFESFISAFTSQEKLLTEFDEGIWCLLLETVTVHTSGEFEFRFKDGSTIKK